MGLFVLAFLAASSTSDHGESFGVAAAIAAMVAPRFAFAASHPLLVQMVVISLCVSIFFVVGYGAARRWLDPLMKQLRKLSANEAVPSCVLALVLVYAIGAEWLGSVAGHHRRLFARLCFCGFGIQGRCRAQLLCHRTRPSDSAVFRLDWSDERLSRVVGTLGLMFVVILVAVIGKLVGCGLAALGSGMDWVRSLRVGCGMISRGEVGLIVTAMGASTGIFGQSEVAVMVAVVLLTTLLTPLLCALPTN